MADDDARFDPDDEPDQPRTGLLAPSPEAVKHASDVVSTADRIVERAYRRVYRDLGLNPDRENFPDMRDQLVGDLRFLRAMRSQSSGLAKTILHLALVAAFGFVTSQVWSHFKW